MLSREPEVLGATHGSAIRQDGSLTLRLVSGRVLRYKNSGQCANEISQNMQKCKWYALVDYRKSAHLFVMFEGHAEGGFFWVVDDEIGTSIVWRIIRLPRQAERQ